MKPTLVIVDGHGAGIPGKPRDGVTYVFWRRGQSDPANIESLDRLLEENFERLRAEYVEWRDRLPHLERRRVSLVNALDAGVPGCSLWWATSLAATTPESFGRIADVLKLRLLEQKVLAGSYREVEYVGANRMLAHVLRAWCADQARRFRWIRTSPRRRWSASRERLLGMLPYAIQAAGYLKAFIGRRLSMRTRPAESHPADMVVATFFPNINERAAAAGVFESRYWGRLHQVIEQLNLRVTWLWFFTDTPQMRLRDAVVMRDYMRSTGDGRTQFMFLEQNMTLRGLCRSLRAYARLYVASLQFRQLRSEFRLSGSSTNFFWLLADDWYSSLRGANAMFIALYDEACLSAVQATPPSASRLLYWWENQSWEHLLVRAWRRTRSGQVLAAAQSPNCASPRAIRNTIGPRQLVSGSRLVPDRLIAIGKPAARAFADLGWPADRITDAEALRYEYLATKRGARARTLPQVGRHLLVITGIIPAEVRAQLRLLADAAAIGGLERYQRVSVKAHPFCPVDSIVKEHTWPRSLEVVRTPLEEALEEADVAFASGNTSAVVEVAWMGIPLIVSAPLDALSLTPFDTKSGVRPVSTPEELAVELSGPRLVLLDDDYFTFDVAYERWKALIRSDATA